MQSSGTVAERDAWHHVDIAPKQRRAQRPRRSTADLRNLIELYKTHCQTNIPIQRCLFTLRSFTSKIIRVEVSQILQCPMCGQLARQISKLSLGEVKNVLGRVQRRWKMEHGLFLYCFERALYELHRLVFCGLKTVQSLLSYRVFCDKHCGLYLCSSRRHGCCAWALR